VEFLILLLSVPISVLANLLTPIVADVWSRRSKARARKNIDGILSDYALIMRLRSDRIEFIYYIAARIPSLFSSFSVAVFAGVLFVLQQLQSFRSGWLQINWASLGVHVGTPIVERILGYLVPVVAVIALVLFQIHLNKLSAIVQRTTSKSIFARYNDRILSRLKKLGVSEPEVELQKYLEKV
jgi:hypothetical protein